jgi:hypothetical protein
MHGHAGERLEVHTGLLQRPRLLPSPRIGPGDQRCERPQLAAEPDQPVHRGADRDRQHFCIPGRCDTLGQSNRHGRQDGAGVLDRLVGRRLQQRVLADRDAPPRRPDPKGNSLDTGGARVQPDDDLRRPGALLAQVTVPR